MDEENHVLVLGWTGEQVHELAHVIRSCLDKSKGMSDAEACAAWVEAAVRIALHLMSLKTNRDLGHLELRYVECRRP